MITCLYKILQVASLASKYKYSQSGSLRKDDLPWSRVAGGDGEKCPFSETVRMAHMVSFKGWRRVRSSSSGVKTRNLGGSWFVLDTELVSMNVCWMNECWEEDVAKILELNTRSHPTLVYPLWASVKWGFTFFPLCVMRWKKGSPSLRNWKDSLARI